MYAGNRRGRARWQAQIGADFRPPAWAGEIHDSMEAAQREAAEEMRRNPEAYRPIDGD